MPKNRLANLRFRKRLLQLAAEDPENAKDLIAMCSRDPLFYINCFCYTFDPRSRTVPTIPMVTYDFQDDAILGILDAAKKGEDVLIDKSRDMGASWINIFALEYIFHFKPMRALLMVSRTEEYVDKRSNPKALFWKVDFIYRNQPKWLVPNLERVKLHYGNLDNGSSIDGESTTGDVARGDRRYIILLDEFAAVEDDRAVLAATRDATNCRVFNSTPRGTGNAFYELAHNPNIRKMSFHWSKHPLKNQGLYQGEGDDIKIIDTDYEFPSDYNFINDGKLRSPWYDRECTRVAHPMEIAQELDIDYLGSNFQYFDSGILNRYIMNTCTEPIWTGELMFMHENGDVIGTEATEKGNAVSWQWFDESAKSVPTNAQYIAAVDISTGTGASNSVIVVYSKYTREKVFEYVNPHIKPHNLAVYAVAVCKFFNNAYIIWEANGPGRIFGDTLLEINYYNIYYQETDRTVNKRVTDVPGWYSTTEKKAALLGEYRKALEAMIITNKSKISVQECSQYVYSPANQQIIHAKSANKVDPSGARDNHGDRVIADALAFKLLNNFTSDPTSNKPSEAPPGSLAHRRKHLQQTTAQGNWW